MYIGRVYEKPHKSTRTSFIVQYISYLNNRKPSSQTLKIKKKKKKKKKETQFAPFFPVARTQAFTGK